MHASRRPVVARLEDNLQRDGARDWGGEDCSPLRPLLRLYRISASTKTGEAMYGSDRSSSSSRARVVRELRPRGNLKRVRDASVCLSPFSSLSLQSLAPSSVPTPVPRILAPTLPLHASSREAGPSPFFPTLLPCLPKRVPNMARLTFLLVSVLALVPSLSVATVAVDPATIVAAPHSRLGRKAKVRRHDRPT